MWIARDQDGQATVELVALLPVLGVVVALAWQALLAGETWWLASTAAREAARAQALGADPVAAARASLPSAGFRREVRVRVGGEDEGAVAVRLPIPSVVGGGVRLGVVSAHARMEPQR
jgi:Flp pilus assembly protein TadG